MIELKKCKEIISKTDITDKHFIDLHITVEGYLKRLLFIGLRKNDIQYKTAQEAITKYHENLSDMIAKMWTLLGIDYNNEIKKYGKYNILEDYVLNFTSKYRNYRVHGIYNEIKDYDLLKALITIDKSFIKEIEEFLKYKSLPSAFDEPKKWGAKISKIKNIEDVFDKLLGKRTQKKQIYSKEDAIKMIFKENLSI